MKLIYDIPAFWGLFRSVNRDIYIEALLTINDEYQYNNYFLSREACVQILSDMCSSRRYAFMREDNETEEDEETALPGRILNWLVRTKWLRKIEDYEAMTTNKALQDMLHNMDKFFERLLNKQSYDELLKEHLEGYVEEVVRRKYHILKTSDNFYIYKMDIKRWLKEMREDDAWVERIRQKQHMEQKATEDRASVLDSKRTEDELPFLYTRRNRQEDVLDLIDQIERGFDDIEHRISNMDKEHSKYIRATVSRLNYLLSDETERHGMLILLLNKLGSAETESEQSEMLKEVAGHMNLSSFDVLSDNPLYKRRRRRKFEDDLQEEEEPMELSREDVLRLNKIEHRYTAKQIEEFIDEQMADGVLETDRMNISDDESFEKLILAYDISMRKNSRYRVQVENEQVSNGNYCYPKMTFRVKQKSIESEQN